MDTRVTEQRLQGLSDAEVQRFSAVAERQETAAFLATLEAEQQAVEVWRRRQMAAWADSTPEFAEKQQRLWLALAACGTHCRHCVDEGGDDLRCPDCACAMDADPGECWGWGWTWGFVACRAGLTLICSALL